MSVEMVKDFYDALSTNLPLNEDLRCLSDHFSSVSETQARDELINFASEYGYFFNKKDLDEFEKGLVLELDKNTLQSVIGGNSIDNFAQKTTNICDFAWKKLKV